MRVTSSVLEKLLVEMNSMGRNFLYHESVLCELLFTPHFNMADGWVFVTGCFQICYNLSKLSACRELILQEMSFIESTIRIGSSDLSLSILQDCNEFIILL
jgi:hypothetical protein